MSNERNGKKFNCANKLHNLNKKGPRHIKFYAKAIVDF